MTEEDIAPSSGDDQDEEYTQGELMKDESEKTTEPGKRKQHVDAGGDGITNNTMCGTFIWWFWFLCTSLLVAYIFFAALVLYSKAVKMEMIFSHRFTAPWFANLSDCSSYGLTSCENLQLSTETGDKLGAWLISPYNKQIIERDAYILYLHGNGGSRGDSHCVDLYNKLSRLGYHVLAIDYRGFGDSEGSPTEAGLIEDAKIAFQLLAKRSSPFPVYIWGHSLGSAVAVQLAAWLDSEHSPEDLRLSGVILEAPFNNIFDGIKYTPLAVPLVSVVPEDLFESYISDVRDVFQSSYWIQQITSPLLILHDTSDGVIDISLGRKLYHAAKDVGLLNVKMVEFEENLGHFQIHASEKLRSVLSNFFQLSS